MINGTDGPCSNAWPVEPGETAARVRVMPAGYTAKPPRKGFEGAQPLAAGVARHQMHSRVYGAGKHPAAFPVTT